MALSNRTLVIAVVGMGVLVAGLNIAEAGKRGGFGGGHVRLHIGGNHGLNHVRHHHNGHHHNGNHHNLHHGHIHHGHHHHGHHHHGHHHHWHYGLYFGRPYVPPVYGYCNPYANYYQPAVPVVDATTPITPDPNGPNGAQGPEGAEQGGPELDAAREAFMSGNYDAATQSLSTALSKNSKDPNALQLQSLVFFAQGKFREAAGLAHVALTSGRGWNWETVRGMYSSTEAYTAQLRRLEQSVESTPNDAATRFLLAYHYLVMGHGPQAARQLQKVVELEPKDKFAAELLKQISSQAPQNGGSQPPAGTDGPQADANEGGDAADEPEASSNVDVAENGLDALGQGPETETETETETVQPVANSKSTRVGNFVAKPVEGVEIQLSLRADQTFNWKVDAKGKKTEFSGTFTIENGELTLVNKADGKKMVGSLTDKSDGTFNFKMKGGQAEDPGLSFNRVG